MDHQHFDRVARSLAMGTPRRTVVGLMAGGLLGSGVAALLSPDAVVGKKGKHKGKGHGKGKGSAKKCKAGTQPCNGGCIPSTDCCNGDSCDTCALEICENGQCGCTGGRVRSKGVCGFVPQCKSVGLTCANDDECCSRSCSIFDGASLRCDKGTELCIVDLDCVSGNCRGFMCPEFYASATGGTC